MPVGCSISTCPINQHIVSKIPICCLWIALIAMITLLRFYLLHHALTTPAPAPTCVRYNHDHFAHAHRNTTLLLRLCGAARWTGVTALTEFTLNPTIGRLSDHYGRRPIMMLSPCVSAVFRVVGATFLGALVVGLSTRVLLPLVASLAMLTDP